MNELNNKEKTTNQKIKELNIYKKQLHEKLMDQQQKISKSIKKGKNNLSSKKIDKISAGNKIS